jgi:hypothetical protein
LVQANETGHWAVGRSAASLAAWCGLGVTLMTFLFLMLCVFGGIAAWPSRKKGLAPRAYDWDQVI